MYKDDGQCIDKRLREYSQLTNVFTMLFLRVQMQQKRRPEIEWAISNHIGQNANLNKVRRIASWNSKSPRVAFKKA